MNVLVTGGAGYIGSHTCKALSAAGITPVTYDNLSTGHRWAVRWGPLVTGDLRDSTLLRATIRKHQIEGVFHFAANSQVGESVRHPRKYYGNNLVNSIALLDAMLDAGVKRIVFSSTCATYGNPLSPLLDESHPQNPINPYGETKLAVERALSWHGHAYGLEWVALRYFNAAGADEDGETGEYHEPETHLIPLVLEAALDAAHPICIYGTDYPTPDGTAIRDYIHVADLADAHVRAFRFLAKGGASRALNLGTGHGHSVREVIAAVERVTDRSVAAIEVGRRAGDPPRLLAAIDLAALHLNWKTHKSLEQIVESAWRWKLGFASRSRYAAHEA